MDDVSCTGNSLNQCSYRSVSNCGHREDVYVTCSGASNFTTRGNYRLANPKNETNNYGTLLEVWGRVEVFNGTKWNQICNVDFTKNNAIVICRSLGLPVNYVGFTNAQNVATSLRYDLVKGPWYYSNAVNCVGTESSLEYCPYKSRPYCSHTEDVYLVCGRF
jgi:hypothetical protein